MGARKFVLDPNVISELRSGKPQQSSVVRAWATGKPVNQLYLSAVTMLDSGARRGSDLSFLLLIRIEGQVRMSFTNCHLAGAWKPAMPMEELPGSFSLLSFPPPRSGER